MCKISVIIPIHNSAAYLPECLGSLSRQTFQDFEAILIDDGSTDSSVDVCAAYAQEDSRFVLLRQERQGVSAARNLGMEKARGEYLFFLDSDDAIHPRLLEEMAALSGAMGADLAVCHFIKLDSPGVSAALAQPGGEPSSWVAAQGQEVDWWFHFKYFQALTCIGGTLLRRSFAGDVRFDRSLKNGEDTVFMHQMLLQGPRTIVFRQAWYYYRMHGGNAIASREAQMEPRFFTAWRAIRDREYQRGRADLGKNCQWAICWSILEKRERFIRQGDREASLAFKAHAKAEMAQPRFRELKFAQRALFRFQYWFPWAYPWVIGMLRFFKGKRPSLYAGLNHMFWSLIKCGGFLLRPTRCRRWTSLGILTFHCADNYGAMLQAYGLKQYLRSQNLDVQLVPYEPPYMTGRHWLVPYLPLGNVKRRLRHALITYKRNRKHAGLLRARRKNMKRFRYGVLMDKGQPRLFFPWQLRRTGYRCLILGSDQIWNPEITLGLRPEYFGAFQTPVKSRAVAYAASIGKAALPAAYDGEFAKLVQGLNAVSVREEEAVPYVQRAYGKEVRAVADPVLLLDPEDWRAVAAPVSQDRFVFLYMALFDQAVLDYALAAAREAGLSVVEVRPGMAPPREGVINDFTAGPAEFLGYIQKARYVVTNSFHGTAFSIIYQKQFTVFPLNAQDTRIPNILRAYGLENRLHREGNPVDIGAPIDWPAASSRGEAYVKASKAFLLDSLGEFGPKTKEQGGS